MNPTPRSSSACKSFFTGHVRWLLAGMTGALLGGCASVYQMNVTSSAIPSTATSYALRNASSKESEASPRYQNAAQLLKTALASRGFREADGATPPELIVDVDFGVVGEERRQSYTDVVSKVERTSASAGGIQNNRSAEGGGCNFNRKSEPLMILSR